MNLTRQLILRYTAHFVVLAEKKDNYLVELDRPRRVRKEGGSMRIFQEVLTDSLKKAYEERCERNGTSVAIEYYCLREKNIQTDIFQYAADVLPFITKREDRTRTDPAQDP